MKLSEPVEVDIVLDNQDEVNIAILAMDDAQRGIRKIISEMHLDGMIDVDKIRYERMLKSTKFLREISDALKMSAKESGARIPRHEEF